ncbi:MAG TPA: glycosyltransferase family 87 protein [Croceibacterium sp.]|nr:glycosyltransferase family 87 protein [Croceibacterium sp.]
MGGATKFLRDADWLNSRRVRGYAILVGLASLALLAVSWAKAMGPEGSDFLAFWGAAKAVLAGLPQSAYDLQWQQRVQTSAGFTGWYAFVNPPPFLFVTAPFGVFSVPLGWIAWVVVTYALWAWAGVKTFPRLWLLVLVFPGALIAAGHAQNGFVTGALLLGGVALLDRRPLAAGALLGALIVKPHLALLVPFWLAAGGRWRTFLAAGLSAVGLLALSWLAFGTAAMLAYSDSWQASAAIMRSADPEFFLKMATLYGQVRVYAGATAATVAAAALALAMVAMTMASWRRFGQDGMATGAAMLAATALASPYLFSYDLPFLVLPVLWLVREGLRVGFRPWEKALLGALWFAPYATRAVALPLGLNLMPLASAFLLWLVWQRGRKSASAPALPQVTQIGG